MDARSFRRTPQRKSASPRRGRHARAIGLVLSLGACVVVLGEAGAGGAGPLVLTPVLSTSPLFNYEDAPATPDADDPAIWLNRGNPRRSLVIGTAKDAGLVVYDMSGRLVQAMLPPNAPQVLPADPPTPAGINLSPDDPCVESDSLETSIGVLAAPDLVRIDLAGQSAASQARGRALWSRARGMVFTASALPPLPAGRVYQVWVVTQPGPVSAGLLIPDVAGGGLTFFETPPDIPPPTAVAVTIEPAGGLPAPTGAFYLVGSPGAVL